VRPRSPRGRALLALHRLDPEYADLTTGLRHEGALQLLVATILSAQCTDERVNTVTPELFRRYRSAEEFAHADAAELERIIHSCGFFRNKARSIKATAQMLCEAFGGGVPASMASLVTLPGVARKTANVVLAHAFQKHEGIAVDTHVQRLSMRLGLTTETDPVRIERELMRLFPRKSWGRVSDVLIWHGRKVCFARSPACERCLLADFCPSATTTGRKAEPVQRRGGGGGPATERSHVQLREAPVAKR
jgi:endonuclease-3